MARNKIYPFAVASVRSMENKLLTKQKLMQMAEAKDAAEALRILSETDYGKTEINDVHEFEKMIQNHLEAEYQAVGKLIASETFMDIFRFKNDYHNVKVLIKEEISKVNGKKYLIQGGSIPVDILQKNFRERNYMELPNIKADAVQEATEMYAKTKNARFIDSILDKACFQVMSDAAEKLGNEYVSKYVRKLADVTNLKTLLRIWQLKRSDEELEESIVPGGELPAELLIKALKNDNVIQMLKDTSYGTLCETYMDQGFTVFEKACDDYLMECIKDAKYKTLTPEPVAAYILAKETEAKCVRIIMTCKLHDIDAETIKERVREAYV
ncbi:MAG: V-type ATP synthase subunit C [Anaerotignum sp.]